MRKFALAFFCAWWCAGALAHPLPDGSVAPNNLGETLGGRNITVSGFHGDVVVISFWATWCKYCLREMPTLDGLQVIANKRHLPLQVVEIDLKEDHRVFAKAVHLLMPKLPGLLMTRDRTGSLARSFGVGKELPAMIILHRDGTIAEIKIGYDKSELDPFAAEISRLLNEPAPPSMNSAHPAPSPAPQTQ